MEGQGYSPETVKITTPPAPNPNRAEGVGGGQRNQNPFTQNERAQTGGAKKEQGFRQTADFTVDENGNAEGTRFNQQNTDFVELLKLQVPKLKLPDEEISKIQVTEAQLDLIREAAGVAKQPNAQSKPSETYEEYLARTKHARSADDVEQAETPQAEGITPTPTKNKRLGTRLKEAYTNVKGKIIDVSKILAVVVIGEGINQSTEELTQKGRN